MYLVIQSPFRRFPVSVYRMHIRYLWKEILAPRTDLQQPHQIKVCLREPKVSSAPSRNPGIHPQFVHQHYRGSSKNAISTFHVEWSFYAITRGTLTCHRNGSLRRIRYTLASGCYGRGSGQLLMDNPLLEIIMADL